MGQRRGRAAAWRVPAASLLAIAFAVGCKSPTQITLSISTDECNQPTETTIAVGPPGEVDGKTPVASTNACTSGDVGTLVIVPSGADDELVGVLVVLSLGSADAGTAPGACAPPYGPSCIVARRALPYLPHQNVNLPVYLSSSCLGMPCADESMTCVEGHCVSATIDNPAACTGEDGGCGEVVLETADGGVSDSAASDASMPPSDADAGGHDGQAAEGGPSDATVRDVVVDTYVLLPDAPACVTANNCYDVPSGWTLVGVDSTGSATCPPGLTSSSSVVANPDGGMCTYSACALAPGPSCTGTVTFAYGGFGACELGTQQLDGTGCAQVSNILNVSFGDVSFTSSLVASCSTPTSTAPTFVPSTQLCSATGAPCGDGPCTEAFGSIDPCVVTGGSAGCPSNFPVKYSIGDNAVAVCPTGNCQVMGACGGMVATYSDGACKTAGPTVDANGVCTQYGKVIDSIELSPGLPSGAGCGQAAPAAPASVTLVNQRTACCLH